MKTWFFLAAIALAVSFPSSAEQYQEMKGMKEFHAAICKEHKKQELCERVVGIMMKSVQQNDDLYMECQKLAPAQRESEDGCRASLAIRQMINGFN